MPRTPTYNEDVIGADLLSARAEGVTWKELSWRYGLSKTRLYQLWRAAGGTPPSIDIGPELLEARAEGLSWAKLSTRFGLSESTIRGIYERVQADHKNVHERSAGRQARG